MKLRIIFACLALEAATSVLVAQEPPVERRKPLRAKIGIVGVGHHADDLAKIAQARGIAAAGVIPRE